MFRLCFYILCLLTGGLLWVWPPPAGAETLGGGPVTLEADRLSYEPVGEFYTATGQVLLQQGTFNLKAEELLFETALQDLAAVGAVRIRQQEDELHGARIHYNLTTGQGRLEQGRVFLGSGNFHLSGSAVAKTGPDSYRVEDGRFTTCDGEIPDWEFTAEQIEVTMGGYARVRNAWFRVRDLPLFYFPYLVYPVKAERETGLLTPQFGYSRERGARISLAWFQVIDRNQDATLYLDYLTEKGVGKGLEYRYLFAGDNLGLARYYHVSGIAETPDMYAVEWQHGGVLPGKVRLTADVEYVDDRLLLEGFSETAEDYNREQTLATVIAQRNWAKFNLAGHLRYLKDLESDNDLTLQRLPELSATVSRYRLWQTPLFFSFESFATRFRSDEAVEGERYSLRPSLGAVLKAGSWLTVAPEAAVTYRTYSVDATTDDAVTVPELSLALSTRLQKVTAFERWGFDRLRHRIEPEVRYVYIPDVDQQDLPFFDLQDRIAERNRIEYALINRFTARQTRADAPPVYREILKLRLSQSYLIDEAASLATPTPEEDTFSALRIELDVRPSTRTFLVLDGDLAVDEGRTFNRLEIAAGLDDLHGNRFEAGYHYLRQEALAPDLQADYLRAELETALLKPVYMHLEERYDIGEDRSLETVVGLEYRARCWSLGVIFRDRIDDQSVTVNFRLAGLGGTEGFW